MQVHFGILSKGSKYMNKQSDNLEQFRLELEEDMKRFEKDEADGEKVRRSSSSSQGGTDKTSSSHKRNTSSSQRAKTSSSHSGHHTSKKSSHHKKKKKKNKGIRLLCWILAILLILALGGYGFVHWELNRIQRNTEDEITSDELSDAIDTTDEFGLGNADADVVSDPNITNILLIGQDRRDGDKAEMRSDAMIICSINGKTKEIVMTSLMRDMYLPIPGYGYGMLNSTYLIGGFDLLNETIEKNFGIPIHGNLEVDFDRFVELMDIVGPIDLNLSQEEATYLNNMQGTNWAKQSGAQFAGDGLVEGTNSLNSKQVLLYCRMRQNVGGDWGRTDRQRKVIMACFNKLKASGAKSILSFAHQAMPLLRTNMSNTSIIKLAYAAAAYKMDSKQSYRLPYEGSYTQEIKEETLHVLVPDIVKNKKAIQKYIYGID